MMPRFNKVLEETVAKALVLSHEGDDFAAVAMMKNQGVPVKVIARVLYNEHQIRSTDLSLIEQYSE